MQPCRSTLAAIWFLQLAWILSCVSALDVSPATIDVFTTTARRYERQLALSNPSESSVTASVRIRYGDASGDAERRLSVGRGSGRSTSGAQDSLPPRRPAPSDAAPRPARRTLSAPASRKAAADCPGRVHRILLRLREPRDDEDHHTLRRRLAADEELDVVDWRHLGHVGIDIADLECESDPERVLRTLKEKYGGRLEFAEVDQRVYPKSTGPDDPDWSRLWGMERIRTAEAWQHLDALGVASSAQTVVVAVIDTGVDLTHPDLVDRLWTNPGEIPGNGVDDDGNGFIDDVHGYDFANMDGDPSDDDGHGSHCAGVVAATANNGVGVAGVAGQIADVQIMALKFLGVDGGLTSDAVEALDYAVAMGAPISSNSWGGGGPSTALEEALRASAEQGHIFVAAAGNDANDNDANPDFPCACEEGEKLCVASTTSSDSLSSFSNFGATTVHLAAPGSDIYSTVPSGSYATMSGTSMACPHVAGAAALLLSTFPYLSTLDVRSLILSSVDPVSALDGLVSTGGVLDVRSLVMGAEALTWLWLLPGEVGEQVQDFDLTLGPGETSVIDLHIGVDGMSIGDYTAAVDVEWGSSSLLVPVSFVIAGHPNLSADWNASHFDWGHVPMGTASSKHLEMRNLGNGTGKVLVASVSHPFSVMGGAAVDGGIAMEIAPGSTVQLHFLCSPDQVGDFTATALVQTNSGLDPWDASQPGSEAFGAAFTMSLSCLGEEPPHLELHLFSGAAIVAPADGDPLAHLEPSVPADWEPYLTGGFVQAPLVSVDMDLNPEGCQSSDGALAAGKILLVRRGSCAFTSKAQNALDAGAVGIIIVDSESITTIQTLSSTGPATDAPDIPCFLISKAAGDALFERLDGGEDIVSALSWAPLELDESDGAVPGVVDVSNSGPLPLLWSVRVELSFGSTQDDFYRSVFQDCSCAEAPTYQWSVLDPSSELDYFRASFADDDALRVELPWAFPFFGQTFRHVFVSSNGLLSFDPSYQSGVDWEGSLRSTTSPNGVVAPFWDDLICSASTKVSADLLPGGDGTVFVIQFDSIHFWQGDMPDFVGSETVSFEVRLHADGRIDMMIDAPVSAVDRGTHKIGLETIDGHYGTDVTSQAESFLGTPFAVSFFPWLTPTSEADGFLEGNASTVFTFSLAPVAEDRQAWLHFAAADESGIWGAERRVRVVQRAPAYAWAVGEWSSCQDCEQSRSVECTRSDGTLAEDGLCEASCEDAPQGWADSWGDTCEIYASQRWCTSSGGYGADWSELWGTFEDYINDGHTAATACCDCGGGHTAEPPARSQECGNPFACLTSAPTPLPTMSPTLLPTLQPTFLPTPFPTRSPSPSPTGLPSSEPTSSPSSSPTPPPSLAPTAQQPTVAPSPAPTPGPTAQPTGGAAPTPGPTAQPTGGAAPTPGPTIVATAAPTAQPTDDHAQPSAAPTASPASTEGPTVEPTSVPSPAPTALPSVAPTLLPSALPTPEPSAQPTAAPTLLPTWLPTPAPSISPTPPPPSAAPSPAPTSPAPTSLPPAPTAQPTWMPVAVQEIVRWSLMLIAGSLLPPGSAGDIMRESIARAINVFLEQVIILDMSGVGGRRLEASSDMHVTFEVVFESLSSTGAASTVSEADRALEQLELMSEEPQLLLDSMEVVSDEHDVELPEEIQVDFSAEPPPSVARVEAAWQAGAWGPCAVGDCSAQYGTMEREVHCVDAASGALLEESRCEELPELSSSGACPSEPSCEALASSNVYEAHDEPQAAVGAEVVVAICGSVVILLGMGTGLHLYRRNMITVLVLEDARALSLEQKLDMESRCREGDGLGPTADAAAAGAVMAKAGVAEDAVQEEAAPDISALRRNAELDVDSADAPRAPACHPPSPLPHSTEI